FKILSKPKNENQDYGGGCLIATATFGSELAPQVQKLRETRDNILMNTKSGKSFLSSFNQLYYSFSPTIADWERQNPIFKETVRIVITPLLTSLLVLNHVDIHSEAEMIGYGMGLIFLNLGMYFAGPAIIIHKLKRIKI
ncbi:MAG: CFI-box-CTERM domain-containing protein, partial [Nitrosopumilaceae archaeon]